jgi:hypothetical protein
MNVRTCVLLAAAGAAIGLVLRLALPSSAPEPALLARVAWWQANAETLAKGHHIERSDETPCGATYCPPEKSRGGLWRWR